MKEELKNLTDSGLKKILTI